jgi:hypothetical protein
MWLKAKTRLTLAVLLVCLSIPSVGIPTAKADECSDAFFDLLGCVSGAMVPYYECLRNAANSGDPEEAGLCGEALANAFDACIAAADEHEDCWE